MNEYDRPKRGTPATLLIAVVIAAIWLVTRTPAPAEGAMTEHELRHNLWGILLKRAPRMQGFEHFIRDCQITGAWTGWCNVESLHTDIHELTFSDCTTHLLVRKSWQPRSKARYTVTVSGDPVCTTNPI